LRTGPRATRNHPRSSTLKRVRDMGTSGDQWDQNGRRHASRCSSGSIGSDRCVISGRTTHPRVAGLPASCRCNRRWPSACG
jgi:hypothetical protein